MKWDRRAWMNFSEVVAVRPERHCYPTSLADLVSLVRDAEAQVPPKRVRAVGSGWSFSEAARTDDYLVETRRLDRSLGHVLTRCVHESVELDGTFGYAHAEAGITLAELSRRLDSRGNGLVVASRATEPAVTGPAAGPNGRRAGSGRWALPTIAGASGQTLAGAISTGTHGADVHRPPLADAVVAMHLVGVGGAQHWIEGDRPLCTSSRLRACYPGVQVHHDTDLLRAAQVAVGRFGIIYAVVLKVVPQFGLREVRRSTTWSLISADLAAGEIFTGVQSLQIAMSPCSAPDGTRRCHVTTTTRTTDVPDGAPNPQLAAVNRLASVVGAVGPFFDDCGEVASALLRRSADVPLVGSSLAWLGDPALPAMLAQLTRRRPGDAVAFVCNQANRRAAPQLTRLLVERTLSLAQRPSTRVALGYELIAEQAWVNEICRGYSLEVFFDATSQEYLTIIDEHILPIFDSHAGHGVVVAGWIGIRFMGRTRALLGMQRWDRTVSVEVAVLRGVRGSRRVLRDVERVAVAHGAVVHWGQENHLDRTAVDRAYPGIALWRQQLAKLAAGATGSRTFENEFCRRRGLTP
jgi:FAD/FMN-containing dehydrogenase